MTGVQTCALPIFERDPRNELLARQGRWRLSAEQVRDSGLAASGLWNPTLGGPSVKPPQPAGLWEAVSYNGELSYEPDTGDGRWRRSVYSYWKRTAPPPGIQMLDGPTRETCTLRRPRTNTPLQALLLLNDETQVEAARALDAAVLKNTTTTDDAARLHELFARATQRAAEPAEFEILRGLLARLHSRYASTPDDARRLVRVGASAAGRDLDPLLLAPWTGVAQAILNLDEVVTRR